MKWLHRALILSFAILPTSFVFAQQQPPNMDEMMKAMQSLMAAQSNAAPTIDFRELKALLPVELPGMKRTNASGEKNSAMGMTISHALGEYKSESDGSVTIEYSDIGGMGGGLMGMMQMGWTSMEVDRESDTGYERTTELNGNKALEKYDQTNQSGELQVLLSNQIMVKLEGNNISMDELKGAIKQIDLTKLAALQRKTATP